MTEQEHAATPGDWRINLLLFALTVLSVFFVGEQMALNSGLASPETSNLLSGWPFAVPFLLILLFHEFGHWLAARAHRVPASLPYFIPMPLVMFGTFGAVITMPERIRSRNALLDIGASGPLAGMVVAIPTMIVGLSLSEVQAMTPPSADSIVYQEGQSLFYMLLKRLVVGVIPEGHDVFLHPTAFAAWAGLFVTMINLLPWGQLDGGHIAYALLGERHHRLARWLRLSLLGLFAYNLLKFVGPVWLGQSAGGYGEALGNSMFWLLWFIVTGLMGRLSGGAEHPACDPEPLSRARRWVAIASLLLFVALFMPTPLSIRGG